jgi:hypothetical protein
MVRVSLVSMYPGLNVLTRTPFFAHSTASEEAMCRTAALAALYGVCGCGMLTICTLLMSGVMIGPESAEH